MQHFPGISKDCLLETRDSKRYLGESRGPPMGVDFDKTRADILTNRIENRGIGACRHRVTWTDVGDVLAITTTVPG